MTRIGIVGLGFMGYTHFEGARDISGGAVTAFATRNAAKLAGDWTGIQGNFGPRGDKKTDLSGVTVHADWRDLIKDNDVSIVDICTPVGSPSRGSGSGANDGFNCVRITI